MRKNPAMINYKQIKGRFAPTPSGPLHFGSLVSAVGSYLNAKSQRGKWIVRIEDVDVTRSRPNATKEILHCLDKFALVSDEKIVFQSERSHLYEKYLLLLQETQNVFSCDCSRKALAQGDEVTVYPGTCRHKKLSKKTAQRIEIGNQTVNFNDDIQGVFEQCLKSEVGDFVLKRADGVYSYHLAVIVDDYLQGVSEVFRGSDLLDVTPRQIFLQRHLNLPSPSYGHFPVATNLQGEKLSKQTKALAIDLINPESILKEVLNFLAHPAPNHLTTLSEIWQWATASWSLKKLPRVKGMPGPENIAY